jgi:hypothetical protein
MNILRELHCAADLNEKQYGNFFTARDLWQMATYNAALATATDDVLGQLPSASRRPVDLHRHRRPPRAQGRGPRRRRGCRPGAARRPADVRRRQLVLEALGHDDAGKCESLDVCGIEKRLCAERETGKKIADLETAAMASRSTSCSRAASPPKSPAASRSATASSPA